MNATQKAGSFQFKQFSIKQDECTMKVGTDGVLLGAWASVDDANHILDIGAGTGVIAIMLGQRTQDSTAKVHAVEIDEKAAAQAKENMQATDWSARMELYQESIQDYSRKSDLKYDLIVSNPPFFSGGTFSHNQDRNDVRHTIKLPHGDLLIAIRRLLSKQGRFCVVLPLIEGLRFQEMAGEYSLYCTKKTKVKSKADKGVERLLLQFEWDDQPEQVDELVIQHEGRNDWTEAYIGLTRDFYLKMP
ncbi:MAG: methyltransferase [Bacteroidota bacterium]